MDQHEIDSLAKRLRKHVDDRTTDMAPAPLILDVAQYFSPDVAQRELTQVWPHHPIVITHSAQIPNPGDFIATDLHGTPVLVVRQADGTARILTNVCRHRGARVESECSGNRRMFACPYHRWSYALDGRLRAIPHDDGFEGIDRVERGLLSAQCEERHGLIWAMPDNGTPLDVAAYLGPELDQDIEDSGLGQAYLYRHQTYTLDMSWKLVMDGFPDAYHLQFLHPATVGPLFHCNTQAVDFYGKHARIVVPRKSMPELTEPVDRKTLAKYIILSYTLYPGTIIVSEPSHFEVWTILPDPSNPSRCTATLRFLTPIKPETDKQRKFLDMNWDVLMNAVEHEDWWVAGTIADGLPSSGINDVIYGRNEPVNQHFHRQLAADIGDPA
jgi:phenylpropionate dioxygenase-like ring-hydroxylating dioxygenase large terminal subunit